MKIKKKNNKISLIIISGVAILAGALLTLAFLNHNKVKTSSDTNLPQTNKANSQNTSSGTQTSTKPSTTNTDLPAATTTDASSGKTVLQMVASVDTSSDTVFLRGGINNAAIDNGSCYAQLNGPNGESIRKDTTLLPNAQTTDCKTISIAKNSLSKGNWTFTLNYSSDKMEGRSSETAFSI